MTNTATRPTAAADLMPFVAFRPVREGQAFEATVEQLATAIRVGLLPTGSALPPERDLAHRLGVSRITLREAMSVLRDLGMVETRRGRGGGSFVTHGWSIPPGPEAHARSAGRNSDLRGHDLDDVLAFRRVLEGGASYLAAARNLTLDDVEYLRTTLRAVTEASRSHDVTAHRQADSQLHLVVAAASGSASLVEALTRNRAHVQDLLTQIPVLERNLEHSNADHAALIDAIVAGEPDDAREIAEEHCDKTAALLRGLVG